VGTLGVFAAIFDDERRILCVKRGYPPFNWTLPGGGVDPGETVLDAFSREVLEETGIIADAGPLIGVYHAAFKDDTVFFHVGYVRAHGPWQPDGEIVEHGWFTFEDLPTDLSKRTRVRIEDAFRGRRGIVRDFAHDTDVIGRINEQGAASTRWGVAAIVTSAERGLLLVQRKYGKQAGRWCIPCGRPEDDEELHDAARRELREETGIEAKIGHIVHVEALHHPDKPGTGVWFLADAYTGEPTAGDDAGDARWFAFDDLPDLAFESDRRVIAKLRAGSVLDDGTRGR